MEHVEMVQPSALGVVVVRCFSYGIGSLYAV